MICGNCTREIPNDSIFCPYCGNNECPSKDGETPEPEDPANSQLIVPAASKMKEPPAYGLFSAGGRVNRAKYFYFILFQYITVNLLIASFSVSFFGVLLFFSVALLILSLVLRVITTIKRFHDLGEPGVNIFFLLVPFYSIYIACKLLFVESDTGINMYGSTERKAWYWQVPLTMLLPPLLLIAAGIGVNSVLPPAAIDTTSFQKNGEHFYDEKLGIGITLPAGWERVSIGGCLVAAQSRDGAAAIALEVIESDNASFGEYSEEDFASYMAALKDRQQLADAVGAEPAEISSIQINKYDIAEKTFIRVDYRQFSDDVYYTRSLLTGTYGGKIIIIHVLSPENASSSISDTMYRSIGTLEIGDISKAANKD